MVISFQLPVAEHLVREFKEVAKQQLDRASSHHFGLSSESASYDKHLRSLRLVGLADAVTIFKALWAWRSHLKRSISPQDGRVVIMDTVFLEASLQLVEDKPWLCSAVLGEHTEAVDRSYMSSMLGRLIRSLAMGRLEAISAIFFMSLEMRIASETQRHEVLALITAMKCIELTFDSYTDMAAAVNFLEHADPLKHVPPYKKSQVQHALANMLSHILQPLIMSDTPRRKANCNAQMLNTWYTKIFKMQGSILDWAPKKAKHIPDGYPLAVDLWCLEDDKNFNDQSEKVIKPMLKALKQKEIRIVGLRCLLQCTKARLHRSSQQGGAHMGVEDLLNKLAKALISMARKGISGSSESQDLIVLLCVIIGDYHPRFVVEKIIIELLRYDNWECATLGLRILLELMLTAGDNAKRGTNERIGRFSQRTRQQLVTLETHELEPQLLEYIRSGRHVLELLHMGNLISTFTKDIRKLLGGCTTMFGTLGSARGSASDVTKDTSMIGINLFSWCLRLIPYLLPEDWQSGGQLAEVLPQFTLHPETMVASVARRTMKNVLSGMPVLGNSVIMGMVNFVLNLGDEATQATVDGLRHLLLILKEWHVMESNPLLAGGSQTTQFDIHRLEGAGLCLLASTESEIRILAVELLLAGSELHKVIEIKRAESMLPEIGTPTKEPLRSTFAASHGAIGGEESMYVSELLQEVGQDIVARCYWDFGEWSDLMRRWKPIPENITLVDVMRSRADQSVDFVRWSRCLPDIAKETSLLCASAVDHAYMYVSRKLMKLVRYDSNGRLIIPLESNDQKTLESWRNYTAFACGCPLHKKSGNQSEVLVPTNDLVNVLLAPTYVQSLPYHLQSSVMVLGHCNPDCYETLARNLKPMFENLKERNNTKQKIKARAEEVRLSLANILRNLSDSMPRGILKNKPILRKRFLTFLDSTTTYLQQLYPDGIYSYIYGTAPDSMGEIHQLCYCLSIVAVNAGPELNFSGAEGLGTKRRKTLFTLFSQWCSPGLKPGSYEQDMDHLKAVMRNRLKDADSRSRLFDDLHKSCAQLAHAARMAMVAMLQGPLFDSDKRLTGPIFAWIEHLLTSGDRGVSHFGPSQASVARQALVVLLLSNLSLFDSYVDKCYSDNPEVAAIYFQAVCEVYCSCEFSCAIQNMLSLVLYKCVDPKPEIREDAFHMLKMLSTREWEGKGPSTWFNKCFADEMGSDIVVVGSLQDSCQRFQYQLSKGLAREHPEVNERLCVELMTRQLVVVNQGVLLSLKPWMEQLSFAPGDCECGDRLLKSMYYVTQSHGSKFSSEVEKLWSTVATNTRNVRPLLDFLVSFGVKECSVQDVESVLHYFSVLKRISLYLARANAQQAITHLVSESSHMIQTLDHVGVDQSDNRASLALKFSGISARPGSQTPEGGTETPQHDFGALPPHHRRARKESRDTGMAGYVNLSSLSMHSDGSFDGSQMSAKSDHTPLGQALKRSPSSVSAAIGSERRGSVAPSLKGLMQRSELSICLLAEVAFEHGDKFTDHVPLLFHICVICMDSPEPVLRLHCQELMVNLLCALMTKNRAPGSVQNRREKLSTLINYIKSMKGLPLWQYEDLDLQEGKILSELSLRKFVLSLREHLDSASLDQWTQDALAWAVEARSRHLSCRSLQVLRALAPNASSELVINLLCCLRECFKAPDSHRTTAMECVIELLEMLEVLIYKVEPTKLVLYPQLYWISIVLLSSDYIRLHMCAIKLLHLALSCLDMGNETTVNILLATAPGAGNSSRLHTPMVEGSKGGDVRDIPGWGLGAHALSSESSESQQVRIVCVQQLLVKGLLSSKTESLTVQLLTMFARQLSQPNDHFAPLDSTCFKISEATINSPGRTGNALLLGDVRLQITVTLVAIVPWVIMQNSVGKQRELVGEVCSAVAEACSAEGWGNLGMIASVLGSADQAHDIPILSDLARCICDELPPWYQALAIGYWLALVQSRDAVPAKVGLQLLGAIFGQCWQTLYQENIDVQLVAQMRAVVHIASDAFVFSVISKHLQGSLGKDANEVLSTIVACTLSPAGDVRRNREDLTAALWTGINLHEVIVTPPDHVRAAISGILETCPTNSRESSRKEFMPFIGDSTGTVQVGEVLR